MRLIDWKPTLPCRMIACAHLRHRQKFTLHNWKMINHSKELVNSLLKMCSKWFSSVFVYLFWSRRSRAFQHNGTKAIKWNKPLCQTMNIKKNCCWLSVKRMSNLLFNTLNAQYLHSIVCTARMCLCVHCTALDFSQNFVNVQRLACKCVVMNERTNETWVYLIWR